MENRHNIPEDYNTQKHQEDGTYIYEQHRATVNQFLTSRPPQNGETSIEHLPKDVLVNILAKQKELDAGDINSIVRSTRVLNGLFKTNMIKITAEKLVTYVVNNELKKAAHLIKSNPNLLLEKVTVKDRANRSIKNVNAYQAAICSGNIKMINMMNMLFTELHFGMSKQETQKSQLDQFNSCLNIGDLNNHDEAHDFKNIFKNIYEASEEDILNALSFKATGSKLESAIDQFRDDFDSKYANIDSCAAFNYADLMFAITLFETIESKLSSNAATLFWRQVVGYVQRYLPTGDLPTLDKEEFEELGFKHAISNGGQWVDDQGPGLNTEHAESILKESDKWDSIIDRKITALSSIKTQLSQRVIFEL
jgi:hypothetical protein